MPFSSAAHLDGRYLDVPRLDDRLDDRHSEPAGARRRQRVALIALGGLAAVSLTGCGEAASRGFLPRGATDGAQRVQDLWIGSWIAALVVGCIVWGLTIYCMVAFRRRKGETGLPPQLRYNLPIEILYTVLPVLMIGTLFYFTERDTSALLDTSTKPDTTVQVIGKRWSWDFNYKDADVYDSGIQATLSGKDGVEKQLPTLVLPVNKRIQFDLTSRDVIHSFWIPAFEQKLDMIPNKTNSFQVVTRQTGTFQGKCAELCGSYHAAMLFNVKVVSQEEYDQHMKTLAATGKTGQLSIQLSPGLNGASGANDEGRN